MFELANSDGPSILAAASGGEIDRLDASGSCVAGVLAGRLRSLRRSGLGGEGTISLFSIGAGGGGRGGRPEADETDGRRCPGISVGTEGRLGNNGKSASALSSTGGCFGGSGSGTAGLPLRFSVGTAGIAKPSLSNCLSKLSTDGKTFSNLSKSTPLSDACEETDVRCGGLSGIGGRWWIRGEVEGDR